MHLELFKSFEDNKVRYLVVGGVPVVLHGFLRATADLDLMISFQADNVAAFLKTVKALEYHPRVPVNAGGAASGSRGHQSASRPGGPRMSESHREPNRGVQLYVREKALEFIHLTAEEKLAWLDEINMLYWAGAMGLRDAPDSTQGGGSGD